MGDEGGEANKEKQQLGSSIPWTKQKDVVNRVRNITSWAAKNLMSHNGSHGALSPYTTNLSAKATRECALIAEMVMK